MNHRFEAFIEIQNVLLTATDVEIAIKEGLRAFAIKKAQEIRRDETQQIFVPSNFLAQFENVAVRLNPIKPMVRTVFVQKKHWGPDDDYLVVEAQVTGGFREGQEVTITVSPK